MRNELTHIFNFIRVSPRIITAGQPLKHEIPLIIEDGSEVVISLVPEGIRTEVPEEQELFEQAGIVFERIPVEWTCPRIADFRAFLKKMDLYRQTRLFIHCEANMRVSVFMALYHIIVDGRRVQDAMAGIAKIWNPNDTWQAFIEQVLADTRAVSTR